MSGMNRRKRRYAHVSSTHIKAIIEGEFLFHSPSDAEHLLFRLKKMYIISSQDRSCDQKSLRLWIKGFEISDEEKTSGYLGNYADVSISTRDDLFTLHIEKLRKPLHLHPQRSPQMKRMPNWGHPVLRGIKRGNEWEIIEYALAELAILHQAFPDVTIPDQHRLHLLIYSRGTGSKPKIVKYTLSIEPTENGTFKIIASERASRRKKLSSSKEKALHGFFTSRLVSQRNRRK